MIVSSFKPSSVETFPRQLPKERTLSIVRFGNEGAPKKPSWVSRNISIPTAEWLGKRFNLSKKAIALWSSGLTVVLITLAHAPLVPVINKGVIKNYKSGVDTFEEVAQFANDVTGPTDGFTKKETVLPNGRRQIVFEEKEKQK